MAPTIGVNLRVTGHCNQGGRKYMEDAFVVAYQQTEDEKDLEYAYFGIFDGHGGREAALFAKEHLMSYIVNQKNFWSEDDSLVLKAIRDGFITTHLAMWKEVGKWPKTMSGLPSTSGTTSSVAFIRRGKLYIGHVGDSKIVLGYQEPGSNVWAAHSLTKDHKPESAKEKKRIYSVGGLVMSKAGVERVVWNRPRVGHKGPIRRSTHFDQIPFLAVARSLGDLWSYNYSKGEFVVSPEPDVSVYALDPKRDRCIILASDGLWNMVSASAAVSYVHSAEKENEQMILEGEGSGGGKPSNNPSKLLVDKALSLWYEFRMRADNTSVVTVLLDPPGPPKSKVLLRQRIMQKLRPRDELAESESLLQIGSPESNSIENKCVAKQNSEVECSKNMESSSVKKSLVFEARTSNLPKPVVLSPQRVHVKLSPEKSAAPTEQSSEQKESEKESASAVVPDNTLSPESKVPDCPTPVSEVTNSAPCAGVSDVVSNNVLNSNIEHSKTPLPCTTPVGKEDSCKCPNVDSQKESARTHLSEVDNIVKIDSLEDRLSERLKSAPWAQENKSKIPKDNHSAADSRGPVSHKRKHHSDGETTSASKTLKLGGCSWRRDSLASCQVTAARELVHNTRSQQRSSRKVKVR